MNKRFIIIISALISTVILISVAYSFLVQAGKRSFANATEPPIRQDAPDPISENASSVSDVPVDSAGPTDTPAAVTESPVTAPNTDTTAGQNKADPAVPDSKGDQGPNVIDRLVAFGYEGRMSRDIDTIVIHSSYDALGSDPYSVSGVIDEYRQSGVSPHYLIDRKGMMYRLVADRNVAYHAGVSKMPDGRTGVNEFSIGIEVIGKDTDSPTDAQYAALRSLVSSLRKRYTAIGNVLGHSDIAPGRKTDPWNFDWKKLK